MPSRRRDRPEHWRSRAETSGGRGAGSGTQARTGREYDTHEQPGPDRAALLSGLRLGTMKSTCIGLINRIFDHSTASDARWSGLRAKLADKAHEGTKRRGNVAPCRRGQPDSAADFVPPPLGSTKASATMPLWAAAGSTHHPASSPLPPQDVIPVAIVGRPQARVGWLEGIKPSPPRSQRGVQITTPRPPWSTADELNAVYFRLQRNASAVWLAVHGTGGRI